MDVKELVKALKENSAAHRTQKAALKENTREVRVLKNIGFLILVALGTIVGWLLGGVIGNIVVSFLAWF